MNWLRKLFNLEPVPEPKPKKVEAAEVKVKPKEEKRKGYFDMKWTIMRDGRVRLETDWDDLFIKELREQGFTGSDDDQIIQKYIAMVHAQNMSEEKGRPDEYK
jgi:hypothetical protein